MSSQSPRDLTVARAGRHLRLRAGARRLPVQPEFHRLRSRQISAELWSDRRSGRAHGPVQGPL